MNLTPEQEEKLRRIREQRQSGYGQLSEIPGQEPAPVPEPNPLDQGSWQDTPAAQQEMANLDVQNNAQPEVPAPAVEPEVPVTPQVTTTPDTTEDDSDDSEVEKSPMEKAMEATSNIGEITKEGKEKESDVYKKQEQEYKDYQAKKLKEQEDLDKELKSDRENYQTALDNYNKMEYKGFWENKSTGEKILGAISIALGAYAQAVSGGKLPNTALNIINKAMDDDFAQYKEKANKKLKLIDQSRMSIQDKQRARQGIAQDLAAYRAGQAYQVETKINEIQTKTGAELAPEQADKLNAALEQRKLESEQAEAALEQKKIDEQKAKEDELMVSGYGPARNKEMANKLNENLSNSKQVVDTASEILKISENVNISEREKIAQINSLKGFLIGKLRLPLQGPGAMTESDREQLEALIGDPAKLLGLESIERKKLLTIIDRVTKDTDIAAETHIPSYAERKRKEKRLQELKEKQARG